MRLFELAPFKLLLIPLVPVTVIAAFAAAASIEYADYGVPVPPDHIAPEVVRHDQPPPPPSPHQAPRNTLPC